MEYEMFYSTGPWAGLVSLTMRTRIISALQIDRNTKELIEEGPSKFFEKLLL
jgi:hypothetical protein